jgi:hypothetical protein
VQDQPVHEIACGAADVCPAQGVRRVLRELRDGDRERTLAEGDLSEQPSNGVLLILHHNRPLGIVSTLQDVELLDLDAHDLGDLVQQERVEVLPFAKMPCLILRRNTHRKVLHVVGPRSERALFLSELDLHKVQRRDAVGVHAHSAVRH